MSKSTTTNRADLKVIEIIHSWNRDVDLITGSAMVTFSTVDEADEAIESLSGEDGIELTLVSAVSVHITMRSHRHVSLIYIKQQRNQNIRGLKGGKGSAQQPFVVDDKYSFKGRGKRVGGMAADQEDD